MYYQNYYTPSPDDYYKNLSDYSPQIWENSINSSLVNSYGSSPNPGNHFPSDLLLQAQSPPIEMKAQELRDLR